jgi:hypothetical protein
VKVFAAFIICYLLFTCHVHGQGTEIFISTQSGSPVGMSQNNDEMVWNFSLGLEHYIEDKLSISGSWRKLFYLSGGQYAHRSYSNTNYTTDYSETYDSYALDFESKYFFDQIEDGWYMSSGISYQHITLNVDVENLSYAFGNLSPTQPPFTIEEFKSTFDVFPIGFKIGNRSGNDSFVFDYYLGLMKNLGRGNVVRVNEEYLEYNRLNKVSFVIGLKMGFKI